MSDMTPYTQQNYAGGPTPDQPNVPETPKPSGGNKSLMTSYLLAFFTGWLGLHRFYLGNFLLGLLYMFSLGGFGIAILIDLIFMRKIVDKANARISAPPQAEDVLLDEEDIVANPEMNPLYSAFFAWRWLKYGTFLLFMVLAPYMYFDFFGDVTFAGIMFLLYFVVVYNKWFAARMANEESLLWKIPGIRSRMLTIINGFSLLRRYYASKPPVGWIRSFFSVFLVPFSAEVRKEWKLFNGLLAFGMIFVIFQFAGWGWEYVVLYKPELTVGNLLQTKLVVMVVSAIVVMMLVIPIIRTLTYVELAGDVKKGRGLVIFALIGVFTFPLLSPTESYPHEEYARLQLRVTRSKSFAKKFNPFVKQFIAKHRSVPFSDRFVNDGKKPIEYKLKNTRLALGTSIELTRKFRQQLVNKKIVFRSEVNGFRILAFDAQHDGQYHSALLLFTEYGTSIDESKKKGEDGKKPKDLDWHKFISRSGPRSLRQFVSLAEVEWMYRILLARMKNMGVGDQLSPDYKGKTSNFKSNKPLPKAPKALPRRAKSKLIPVKRNVVKKAPIRKKPKEEGDDDDDDDDDDGPGEDDL